MTFTAVGSFVQTSTTTLALNPAKTGNFYLVSVITQNATVYCSSISGGNCTWSTVGSKFPGANNANFATLFIGKATATGAANATLTLSGTSPGFECVAQQFSSTAGAWAQDGPQGTLDLVTGTATWPSLTPSGSGGLYFGFFFDSGTASAGSTSGYTYDLNTFGDGLAFNPALHHRGASPGVGGLGSGLRGRDPAAGNPVRCIRPCGAGAAACEGIPPGTAVQFPARVAQRPVQRDLQPVLRGPGVLPSYSTGLISANYGTLPQPYPPVPGNAGPVFYPATSPARIRPHLPPRGRSTSNSGAPVRNPAAGVAFRQRTFPARIRITLPPRGRIGSNRGTAPATPRRDPCSGRGRRSGRGT